MGDNFSNEVTFHKHLYENRTMYTVVIANKFSVYDPAEDMDEGLEEKVAEFLLNGIQELLDTVTEDTFIFNMQVIDHRKKGKEKDR